MGVKSLILDVTQQETFGLVLGSLQVHRLTLFASSVRFSGHSSTGYTAPYAGLGPVACEFIPKISCGSYHAVITLSFTDGRSWVLKIPAHGHIEIWDKFMAQGLLSEAQTMRLIRRETTIPVPEVYAFDSSVNNELGCPFILMEQVPGRSMFYGWFDDESSPAKVSQFRTRALRGIAEAMIQLEKFTFDKGGALVFDSSDSVSGIGPRSLADFYLMYHIEDDQDLMDNDIPPPAAMGPFDDAKCYLLATLDHYCGGPKSSPFEQGGHRLLQLFIEWSLADKDKDQVDSFVLSHPDFDTQNIFVTDDGTLTGIIDWDWVAAVPRSVGCRKFPKFLMADYDPANYEFDREKGEATGNSGQCSPTELTYLRAMYAQFMEHSANKSAADETRKSLVMSSLEAAVNDSLATIGLVGHLFDEIRQLTVTASDIFGSEAAEKSDIDEEEEDLVDKMSFEELLEEMNEITTSQNFNLSSPSHREEDPNEGDTTAPKVASRARRIGGLACNLGAKGLRRAAKCLHRKPLSEGANYREVKSASAQMQVTRSRSSHAAYIVHRWTHGKLRDLIESLHCKDSRDAAMEYELSSGNLSGIMVDWVRKLLHTILQKLHLRNSRSEQPRVINPVLQPLNTEFIMNDANVQAASKKKEACRLVAGLLRENIDGLLSVGGQQYIARWLVKNVRPEELPEDVLGEDYQDEFVEQYSKVESSKQTWDIMKVRSANVDLRHPCENREDDLSNAIPVDLWDADAFLSAGIGGNHMEHRHGDSATNHEEEDLQQISNFNNIFGNHNRFERTPHVFNVQDADDKSETSKGSDLSHGAALVGIDDDDRSKDLSTEATSQSDSSPMDEVIRGVAADEDKDSDGATIIDEGMEDDEQPAPKDLGTFTMWDVCIALSNNELDDRRMKRLKEGFLALLNQTI